MIATLQADTFFSFGGVLVLYFVIGIIVNKFVRHKESDLIPNSEFWGSLPGLIKVRNYFREDNKF